MINNIKTISYENRVRFFWTMMAVSAISFCIYIYGINATARNIAARQNLEREISDISANLNTLEFTYIELKNDVTIELAHQYGFKEVRNPLYISRTNSPSLSYNTNGR